jgi:hypothetical protein
MAMSREDISLLYDHDESLTEEQLRREIEHLNAELGKFKVPEYHGNWGYASPIFADLKFP